MSNSHSGYDLWSTSYDTRPNPTVALDDIHFPRLWKHLVGKTVLEIGCGTGRHLAKLIAQGSHVVGIDPSPGMLAVARKKLQGPELEPVEGDFVSYTGFAAERFDAVVVSLVLEHIADLPKFFAKVAAVLKRNGECFLSEIHPQKAAAGGRAYFEDPKTGERTYLESHPHTTESIELAAKDAGLSLTSTHDLEGTPALAAINPEWERYLHKIMVKIWAFEKKA